MQKETSHKMERQNEISKMIAEGQTERAIERLNELIATLPSPDDHAYYVLGNVYRKCGDFARAMGCYLEAMAINPDSPAAEAHRMLTDIIEFYHKDYYNP